MARSRYIYLVYKRVLNDECEEISRHIGSFTVKYESQEWTKRCHGLAHCYRTRVMDGGHCMRDDKAKPQTCPWEVDRE